MSLYICICVLQDRLLTQLMAASSLRTVRLSKEQLSLQFAHHRHFLAAREMLWQNSRWPRWIWPGAFLAF